MRSELQSQLQSELRGQLRSQLCTSELTKQAPRSRAGGRVQVGFPGERGLLRHSLLAAQAHAGAGDGPRASQPQKLASLHIFLGPFRMKSESSFHFAESSFPVFIYIF